MVINPLIARDIVSLGTRCARHVTILTPGQSGAVERSAPVASEVVGSSPLRIRSSCDREGDSL
jgi:hypothetical protein